MRVEGSEFRVQGAGSRVRTWIPSTESAPGFRNPPMPLKEVTAETGRPGFRVQGSGFRVQGSGFRVQGAGFRVQGTGYRVQGSGYRVQYRGSRGARTPARLSRWRAP